MKTYKLAAIPGDGIGTEVVSAGIEVLEALAAREGSFGFKVDHFDWGGEYYKKHGRMMPENGRAQIAQARRHPVRLGRPSGDSRPHHALGPAARHLPAVRPVRQRAADARAARHHLATASCGGQGARLGDRAREFGGRVRRRRRPRAPGLAARGCDRRRHVHPRRRRAHHALRLPAGAGAPAQAPHRRHQVQRPASRHGDVGRDRGRDRRRVPRRRAGTRCWSTP